MERAREESGLPGDMVFLNSARRSPLPRPAHEALQAAIARDYAAISEDVEKCMADARQELASLICSAPSEIAITGSASDSFNVIVNGLTWQAGDNVVITDLSYRSIAISLLRLQTELGVSIRTVPTTDWQST